MAEMNEMTIHQALVELKTLDARITKKMDSTVFIGSKKTNKGIMLNFPDMTAKDFTDNVKAEYQSIRDLIKRRDSIKKAITMSNAVTEIKIGEETFTVAEAIEFKNHSLSYYSRLRDKLSRQYTNTVSIVENKNNLAEAECDSYILSITNSKDTESNNIELIEKLRKEYIFTHGVELVDPIGIKEELDKLDLFIDTFTSNIDSALSTSNALTTIKIEE